MRASGHKARPDINSTQVDLGTVFQTRQLSIPGPGSACAKTIKMADLSSYTHVFRAETRPTNTQRRVYKRTRFPVSCVPCRSRKAKCDKLQPICGACAKRGEGDSCEYTPASSLSTTASRAGVGEHRGGTGLAPRPRQQVALRLQQLEQLVNGLVAANREAATVTAQGGEPPGPGTARGDVGVDTPLAYSSADGSLATPGDEGLPPHSPHVNQAVGNVLNTQGGPNATTHWEAVLESIYNIQGYLEEDEEDLSQDIMPIKTAPAEGPDVLFGPVESITIHQIIDALPLRVECDNLLSLYFKEKYTSSPILHVPAFRRAYEGFWANPGGTSLLWISMLFSTLSTATMVKEAKDAVPNPLRLRYMTLALRCLIAGEYIKAKPFATEAVILYALSRIAEKREPDPYLWSIFGIATRLAQRMGYHRDPTVLTPGENAKISPFEAEMRRRTWIAVEAFDLMYSYQMGMPTIIHDEECDVQLPNNLLDEDFDVDTRVLPPQRPDTEITPILYFRHKSRIIHLLRRLARHALRNDKAKYSATVELDAEMHATHDIVPRPFRYIPIREASFADTGYQILQRTSLEVMHLKALCILHRPFLTFQKDNPKYAFSRRACREAAMKIMELHVDTMWEIRPGGRLHTDRHLLTNLTLHDFLLAATILCLDLKESDLE